jgi:glycosyltransferase involved in cell wall biosynthesis
MNASVSVVIPCFRCAQTIGRALKSVAGQTVLPREVILVDDASDDGTLDVLRQNQAEYGREWIKIIVLEHNSGPSSARNAGWKMATSDYVAFLDADDAWRPEKIEIQYNWMKSHPAAQITGHFCLVLPEGGIPPSLPGQWDARRVNARRLLLSNQYSTPTVMLRRDLPFRFPETQRYAEDYLLWMRIVLASNPAYFINIPLTFLFKARYGAGGLSADLWAMEKGELSNYRQLRRERLIANGTYRFLSFYSLAKYLYRWIKTGKML